MKKTKFTSLLVLLGSLVLTACNAGPKTYDLTFHQTEPGDNEDVTVEIIQGVTTQIEVWALEPEINEKTGYSAEWETYNVEEIVEDTTVEPIYSPISYTATFKSRVTLETLGTDQFTLEDTELTHPALPEEKGYTYAWESYTIKAENITVWCDRTANMHTLKFFEDAAKTIQVGETINFTCETDPTSIEEPTVPARSGYDGSWPEYDLTADMDLEVVAQYVLHQYYVQFRFEGVNVGDPVAYDLEDEYADLEKPEVPTKTGYTVTWPTTYTLTYNDELLYIDGIATGNPYTVSYTGKTETTQVIYGQPYELLPTRDGYAWYWNETMIPTRGDSWNIAEDITISPKYKYFKIDFEDGEIPTVLSGNASNSLTEVVTTNTRDGSKALKVSGNHNYGITFTRAHLNTLFADSEVQAIAFDAKSNYVTNDFRRLTNGVGVCYEKNSNNYGITTEWKTFYYTREYYNNDISGDAFVVNGYTPTGTDDRYTLLDNFRIVKEFTPFGFENGYPNLSVSNSAVWSAGHDQGGGTDNNVASLRYFHTNASNVTAVSITSEKASEGYNSIKITKGNGYSAFYMSANLYNMIASGGYISVDIYSTVAANGWEGVKNFIDGKNNPTLCSQHNRQFHPNGQWVTYTFNKDQMSAGDGRFLILQGSTAGDWYFDNITVHN